MTATNKRQSKPSKITVTVTVKPNSTKGPLVEPQPDGSLVVYLHEQATEGKANAALHGVLAKHYKVTKSSVLIKKGHTSRHKVVQIGLQI